VQIKGTREFEFEDFVGLQSIDLFHRLRRFPGEKLDGYILGSEIGDYEPVLFQDGEQRFRF
jgi:hypothetical protein